MSHATPCTDGGIVVFDTAVGACGVAWSDAGLVGVHLWERDRDLVLRRLHRRFPGASERPAPAEVARAIAAIRDLLAGGDDDLAAIALDMRHVPEFHRSVYALTRAIPPGKTRTYGDIAHDLGDPALARSVGQALGQNPFPIVVPCHRVLGAGGRMVGFSAPGGVDTKRRLLMIEGATAVAQGSLFDIAGGTD